MSVYVDTAWYRYGRMTMCHMLADSLDELHAMADRIGVAQHWFHEKSTPHYDICKTKRALAVRLGAKEVSSRELVTVIRRLRDAALGAGGGEP